MEETFFEQLKDCIVKLKIDEIRTVCEEALASGVPSYKLVVEGMAKGMDAVGKKYQAGEYFLAELIMAGETMKEGMKVLEPHLKGSEMKKLGKVVIGTVRGDLHDIGKNIVGTLLTSAGFEVIDLGVDVDAERFVDAVRLDKPQILGMSALLTVTMPEMEKVILGLNDTGLRDGVKVIVGGAPLTEDYAKKIGADAYGHDAVAGVNTCKQWVSKV